MKQDNKSNSINELDWNFDKLYHHDTADERATLIYRYRLFFSLFWLHSNSSSKVDENSKSWSHGNQRDGNIAAWLGLAWLFHWLRCTSNFIDCVLPKFIGYCMTIRYKYICICMISNISFQNCFHLNGYNRKLFIFCKKEVGILNEYYIKLSHSRSHYSIKITNLKIGHENNSCI